MANALEMRSISKHFGGIRALENVSFDAKGGEVHALLGENGAGKSTLMRILSGDHRPDTGEILLDGERLQISNTQTARDLGIGVIYQEFSLAKHLTVAENIFLDDLGFGSKRINWRTLKARAQALVETLGLGELDVFTPVSELSVAQQQVVEICKAMRRKTRILVFDEPTAVLTERETQRLFALIRRLKAEGVCIIYVSHRLEEIFSLCDRATILKDGRYVDTVEVAAIDQPQLVNLMVGRELSELFPTRHSTLGETVLEVEDLQVGDRVRGVSFNVKSGEVLGFCGLVGAGRTEIMRAVFGADRRDGGEIRLHGRPLANSSPRQAVMSGIGMLPEDRKQQGVFLDLSVRINAMMKPVNPLQGWAGRLRHGREVTETRRVMQSLRIKARDTEVAASTLSGGNQQKVALAKWVSSGCEVLILDEPTRGVDVGAKIEIYQIINDLAESGVAIIVVSSELPELIGLCDRVVVIREGRVSGELTRDRLDEKALIGLAMGVN
jgi:ribose transport system ATP-binding protein